VSIRVRLNILFAIFLVTSFAVGLISLIAVRKYAGALRTMATFYQRAQRAEDLLALVYKQQQIEARERPPSYGGQDLRKEVLARLDQLLEGASEQEQTDISRVKGRYMAWAELGGEPQEAAVWRSARAEALVKLETSVDALRRLYLNMGERTVVDWGMTGFYAELIVGLAFLLILAEVMAASFMLRRWVIKPLTVMSQAAARIGSGDLDYRVGLAGRDEVAHLAGQFDEMAGKLKQHQARLLEAKELATLGAISSSVAHGMRNPLAGIRASAQVLAARFADDSQVRDQLWEIISEVDRLSSRISRLVYLARQSHLELAIVPASEVASAAQQEARSHLQSCQVALETDDQTDGAVISVDKDKLAQTLAELLSNAAHHSRPGGRVLLTSRLERDAGRVCFSVRDWGPGIDPKAREQVFDLFYSTRPEGTGMGLACAKRIVEMHGGTIELESGVGVGTTVTVRIPAEGRQIGVS